LRSDEKHETSHDARCAQLTSSAARQLKISVTQPHSFAYAKTEQYGSCRGCHRFSPELGGRFIAWIVVIPRLIVNQAGWLALS
jgi:hypothetical protein